MCVCVPHLHSLGPVTELSPQEKVVQHGGIHDKENLCVCQRLYKINVQYTQKAIITGPEYTLNTTSERPLSN